MDPARILIVEDDPVIGSELQNALAGSGFDACWVRSGEAALRDVDGSAPDLVLLDLGLPDIDGVLLCRQLRHEAPTSVIVVLTARTAELEVVVALDAGADDYLTKPFRLAELLARLRAHLRRRPAPVEGAGQWETGRVRLDAVARRVFVGGDEVAFRPKEFDLLAVLIGAAGEAVSRERLMEQVWDENWFGSTKTLDVHVSALRRKLGEHGERLDRIATLRGHGYRYEVDL